MEGEDKKIEDNHSLEGKNISQAEKSNITTPEQDNRKLVQDLAEAMGYKQQQEDIDSLKNAVGHINTNIQNIHESLLKIVPVIDTHTKILNTFQPGQTQGTNFSDSEQKIMSLASLVKETAPALTELAKVFKGENSAAPTIISQDYINEQVSNAVKKKFELGDLIYDAVESTLTKGITKKIVNTTLAKTEAHGPE